MHRSTRKKVLIALSIIAVALIAGIALRLVKGRQAVTNYKMTGVYCDYYGKGCVYRVRDMNRPYCPEWWDNGGTYDKVNNLKLKPETCNVKVAPKGYYDEG